MIIYISLLECSSSPRCLKRGCLHSSFLRCAISFLRCVFTSIPKKCCESAQTLQYDKNTKSVKNKIYRRVSKIFNNVRHYRDVSPSNLAAYLLNHLPCERLSNGTLEYRSRLQYSYIGDSVLYSPARHFAPPHIGQSLRHTL